MRKLGAFLSRIFVRLLAFNLLLVFLPVAGSLYFDIYESHLLQVQERSMVQQGRLLAAALSNANELSAAEIDRILAALGMRTDARLRIIDATYGLLGDSSRASRTPPAAPATELPRAASQAPAVHGWLYRLGSFPYRLYRWAFTPPRPDLDSAEFYDSRALYDGPEVRAALDGRYGATTRISSGGQRSVTLYSALPILNPQGQTIGCVLVSQSTFRLLQGLYTVRIGLFRVFLGSVALAAILTLVVSTTIVSPLRRLARAAKDHLGRRPPAGTFSGAKRLDEIGDLARALTELTRRLSEHIRFTEAFAADLAHEFRNPLSAIRAAAESLESSASADERHRCAQQIQKEVARLDRLLAGAREITQIDTALQKEPREIVVAGDLLEQIVSGWRHRAGDRIALHASDLPLPIAVAPDRFAQVIDNLLENALSFSPDGAAVDVALDSADGTAVVRVEDRGPGLPEEHFDRIFDRFFSYRPAETDRSHAGLGLSIVKGIVEAYGGSVSASNRPDGGARFEIRLPLADVPSGLVQSHSTVLKTSTHSKAEKE